MQTRHLAYASLISLFGTGAAFAQNDECATAVALTVNVATPFDTTIATLSAEPWPCAASTAPDLWYTYTPPAGGALATVETCGSSYDTALQVFDGTCAALNSLACNDDFCGLQSTISFAAAGGTTYFIRVGGFASQSGTGTILLTEATPPPPQPAVNVVDTLPATWIDISGTGTPLSLPDDGAADITTTIGNALLPAGTVRVGSNGAIRFIGTNLNLGFTNAAIPSTNAFNGDQTLMPFWDDIDTESGLWGEIYWQETMGRLVIQWEATAFFNGSATADTVTFQVQVLPSGPAFAQYLYQDVSSPRAAGGGSATIGYQSGIATNNVEYSFNLAGAVANGDVVSVVPAGPVGVGTNYCTANANSTGVPAAIAGSGSAVIASNDLTLNASNMPNNAFGFFLTSTTQATTPNPGGSQGILCLGGSIGRYVGPGQIQNTGSTGSFSLLLDLNQIPTPTGSVAAMVGQARNFQAWYRDSVGGSATSNFTNGLNVVFQ